MRSRIFPLPGDDDLVEYLNAIQDADDHNHRNPYATTPAPMWPLYRDLRNPAEQQLTADENHRYRWFDQNDGSNG